MFVVLDMEEEDQMERIRIRHNGDEHSLGMLSKIYKLCEPAAEEEENVIALKITKEMSREDVVNRILQHL